jgi:hypothetical protein
MMTEYMMRPSRIMMTEKIVSPCDLVVMLEPTEVVADTAQINAIQYWLPTGWFAHIGCGTHGSARRSGDWIDERSGTTASVGREKRALTATGRVRR